MGVGVASFSVRRAEKAAGSVTWEEVTKKVMSADVYAMGGDRSVPRIVLSARRIVLSTRQMGVVSKEPLTMRTVYPTTPSRVEGVTVREREEESILLQRALGFGSVLIINRLQWASWISGANQLFGKRRL